MINMLDFHLEDLKKWLKENGEKEFRGKQVFEWINKGEFDFREMKNLPEATRNKLISSFSMSIPEITKKLESSDNSTCKFLLRYSDGNIIEVVVMKYKHGNTICVSTQVGCKMGCKFCASTIGGLIRNLSSGEILGQILTVQKHLGERISNVVLMGSGEPLDNYENTLKFIQCVNDDKGLNIGQRHITLSTCGIVPNIKALADTKLQITLAISLHAAKDELRKTMMPVANKYSLEEIMDACKYYINSTNRRITFEYALVRGINDSKENASDLIKLLRGLLCHVNLIPINEIKENEYKKSSTDNVTHFSNMLSNAGIETTVRREMGADIEAACGQLKRSYLEG